MSIEVHPLFGSGGSAPRSAKDFTLWEVGVDLAMQLNDTWHSVLPKTDKGNLLRNKHKAFYAIEYDGRYYGVGIWTSPVAGNRLSFVAIELRRLAIGPGAPKNTATRMLRLMREDLRKKFPEIKKCISYQAVDDHFGTIYKADNWVRGNKSEYQDWHVKADRNPAQTKSAKIRWERFL